VYRELYQSRVYGSDQAAMIAEVSADDPPEYFVAGPDLWHESGEIGIWGQSTAETYEKVWRHRGFRTTLRRTADDRIMGW
jgi:hypothetical protein